MDFTLYSIGDAAFLEQVLIAIAMINGSGDFEMMVAIGLLLGVLIVSVQSLFNGAKAINWHQVFLGWLVYGIVFLPTVTVNIEDVQRGEVRPVDNVPLGVGIAGGVISKIGYGLAELMEQAFSPIYPSLTENGYVESMQILNKARRDSYNTSVIQAINDSYAPGADFARSARNYIAECTLRKLEQTGENSQSVLEKPLTEALLFSNVNYGTRVYLSDPAGQNLTCTQAFSQLNDALRRVYPGGPVDARLSELLGLNTDLGESALSNIGDALQSLGQISASASDYVKTAIVEPLYYEAVSVRHMDLHDYNSALMVSQAVAQRNAQWAAEHSLFMTVVDPVLAFFEGFIYGITPIMAFIIMLGGMGISLAMKYILVLIWVQLWYPILSITNLYLYVAASGELEKVLGSKDITSMYGLNEAGDVLQNWIATGGMLAAATPMLALFIITGSTYTFNSLASRVNGADHINEKMMSPDALETGPVVKSMPENTWNSHIGMVRSGTENLIPTIEAGQMLQSAASSAETTALEKSADFQRTVSDAFSTSASNSERATKAQSLNRIFSASNSENFSTLVGQAKNYLRSIGEDTSRAYELAANTALAGTASAGVGSENGKFGGQLNAAGSLSQTNGRSSKEGLQLAQRFAQSIGFDETRQNALMKDLQKGFSQSSASEISDTWGFNRSEQIVETAREASKASQQFTQLDQASRNVGVSWKVPANVLGAELVRQGLGSALSEQMRYAPAAVRQQAAATTDRYINSMNMRPDVAQAAARVVALAQHNPSELSGLVGQAAGANLQSFGDPNRNSQLARPGNLNTRVFEEPQSVAVQQAVFPNGNRKGADAMTWQGGEMNEAKVPEVIRGEHGANLGDTFARAQDNAVDEERELEALRGIMTWTDNRSLPEKGRDALKAAQRGLFEDLGITDTSANTAENVGFVSASVQERYGLSRASADYVAAKMLDLPQQAEWAGKALDEEWGPTSSYREQVGEILDHAAGNPEVFAEAIRPLVNYYGVSKPFDPPAR